MSPAEDGSAPARSRPRFPRFGQFLARDPNTQFVLLAAVAGALGAVGAILFRAATTRLTALLLDARDVVAGAESLPVLLRIFLPAAGGLAGGLVVSRFYKESGTQGISQMIEVVTLGRSRVRLRQSLGRAASSIAVIATGGSEGREGPIIQVGAALASTVGPALERLPRAPPDPDGLRHGGRRRRRLQHADRRHALRARGGRRAPSR